MSGRAKWALEVLTPQRGRQIHADKSQSSSVTTAELSQHGGASSRPGFNKGANVQFTGTWRGVQGREGRVEGHGEKRGTRRGTSSAWGSPHKGGPSKAALGVQQAPARGRCHGKWLHVQSLKPFNCRVCRGTV